MLLAPLTYFIGPNAWTTQPRWLAVLGYKMGYLGILVWAFAMASIKTSVALFTLVNVVLW